MDTSITHNGITLELSLDDPPFKVRGLGWGHPAKLIGSYPRDDMRKLVGLVLWGEPVLAVESWAIYTLNSCPISLLLKTKKW